MIAKQNYEEAVSSK